MSLYRRKKIETYIADRKGREPLCSLDEHELAILETADEENSDVARGMLTIIAVELLETARKSDPAYGLTPVDLSAPAPSFDRAEESMERNS